MASIFTKIIDRQIPGHFIYEDDVCVAILDKFPSVPGQALIIPRKEVDYAFDLDDATYSHLFLVAKKLAKALDEVMFTYKTCLVVEGFDVAHVHLKIYPMKQSDAPLGDKIHTGGEADDAELAVIAKRVGDVLNGGDAKDEHKKEDTHKK